MRNNGSFMLVLFQTILIVITQVTPLSGISRKPEKNEDRGLFFFKELKDMIHTQSTLLQDVQSLRKEIFHLSDLIQNQIPTDCYVAKQRGSWSRIVEIKPPGLPVHQVRCDQFNFEGGWTVAVSRNSEQYLRRENDSTVTSSNGQNFLNFNRTWNEYKIGFGDPDHEYWIGNALLHALTRERPWEVLVVLEDWKGNVAYARWDSFRVLGEERNFQLETSGYRKDKSNLGDGLAYHSGSPFSTYDSDNDGYEVHCAMKYGGGWWFNQCHVSYLTGTHLGPGQEGHHAVHWLPWKNSFRSLKKVELMIRPQATK